MAFLKKKLTEQVTAALQEELIDTAIVMLEERLTEPVINRLKKQLAAKAQAEFEADIEKSVNTELEVEEKAQDGLEPLEDHEKEGSPPNRIRSGKYYAPKAVNHTESIDNSIYLGQQQNAREKDYIPPNQSENTMATWLVRPTPQNRSMRALSNRTTVRGSSASNIRVRDTTRLNRCTTKNLSIKASVLASSRTTVRRNIAHHIRVSNTTVRG